MIIDGHAHAFGEFGSIERLIPILDSLKVDKVVLCPAGADPTAEAHKPKLKESFIITRPRLHLLSNRFLRHGPSSLMNRDPGNHHVYSLKEKKPDRIIQFYWVNVLEEDFDKDLLENFNKMKFNGIKLHQCIVPFNNDSQEMQKLSQIAAEKKLPIFIHIYNAKEAKKFVALTQKNKDTNYIVAHMMGMEQIIKNSSYLENIYLDTSTYYIISKKRLLKAIKYFGVDHIIMGSDSPIGYDNLENIILKIKSLIIKDVEKEMIMGGNLKQLLKL
ncbi:MAG: amidohydrolase family protein [Asgard group archaeon]|nr:amidohydrolase family protein [Asgard group archaeon]